MDLYQGQQNDYGDQGWGGYPDAQMSGLGSLTAAPMTYTPNLGPVGSGSSYWPGDVSMDAAALNYIGVTPDSLLLRPSTGTQAGDMAASAGAWDPNFQAGVKAFQGANGDTVDGWIGPQTRTSLAAAVTAANLKASPIAPPQPISPTPPAPDVPPPGVLPSPGGGGGGSPDLPPDLTPSFLSTTTGKVVVGLGVAAVLGGVYYWYTA